MYDKELLTKQINEGLKYLTDREKMSLILFYFEELNEAEISMVLNLKYTEVEMALSNAKIKMRAFTKIFDDIDNIGKQGLEIIRYQ